MKQGNKISILNVEIDSITTEELLQKLDHGVLVTPNVDDVMKHQRNRDFHECASKADFSICDSKILQLSAKFLGTPIKEAIPGSGFFPKYCDYHAADATKIFLLGAKEGVADIAKEKINKRIGREIVTGTYSPPFGFEKDEQECERIVNVLSESDANVILVGLGNPKQTLWIYKYKDRISNIKVWMALGATIDFEAGNIKRAPKIFQRLALEWLYRLCKEPRRMYRRYIIDDMPFFWLLIKQKFGRYVNPYKDERI